MGQATGSEFTKHQQQIHQLENELDRASQIIEELRRENIQLKKQNAQLQNRALNQQTVLQREPAVPSFTMPSTPSITSQEAVAFITKWLYAKDQIFAPPYSRQVAAELTTGKFYADLIKHDGPIAWLQNNNAYYQYGVRKVESVEQFSADGDRASLEVIVTEDRTLYKNGRIDPQQSKFSTDKVRYTLQLVNGTWKIAKYQ